MRIGIDARSLLCAEPRGEGKSLLRLYREVARLRPDWEFVFYGQGGGRQPPLPGSRVEIFDLPGFRFDSWQNVGLPLRTLADRLDVLHCTSSGAPRWCPVPMVMTVHDVIPLVFDEGLAPAAVARFRRQLTWGLERSRRVIAVSGHTRQDLLRLFPVDAGKVEVVHWGADPFPAAPRRNGSPPFVLAFAGGSPRKNTDAMVEAFALAAKRVPEAVLVLVGMGAPGIPPRLLSIAQQAGCTERVRCCPYVGDAELEVLYRDAACLLYVSLYEGFGLPLLEAMGRGVPVIASDATSIPEVTGDAALLVDPRNPAAIAEALVQVLGDAELRRRLSDSGRRRAAGFTWAATAEATVRVLEAAAESAAVQGAVKAPR